jgi:hypothetical protein
MTFSEPSPAPVGSHSAMEPEHSRRRIDVRDLARVVRSQFSDLQDLESLRLDGSLLDEMVVMSAAMYSAVTYRTRESVMRWRESPGRLR